MANKYGGTEASLTAQNTFSDGCQLDSGINRKGHFVLSGTWVATVHFQLSFDGTTWHDAGDFTANEVQVFKIPEWDVFYRFGVKTGNYTSGTVVGRISQ